MLVTWNRQKLAAGDHGDKGATDLVRRSIAALTLAAAVLVIIPATAASRKSEVTVGRYQATVTVSIDAEGELRDAINRYVHEELAKNKSITVVKESADWSILISALEPELDQPGPRRYVMAAIFSEQLRWVDPAIVDELGKTRGTLGALRLKHYVDTQKKLGRLHTIRLSEGKRGGLAKATAQMIRDFDTLCVRPRAKALSESVATPAPVAPTPVTTKTDAPKP